MSFWSRTRAAIGVLILVAVGCGCPLDARLDDINERADRIQLAIDQQSATAAGAGPRAELSQLTRQLQETRRLGVEARQLASREHYEATEESLTELETALGL